MPLWTPAEITTALWLDAADAATITIDTGVSVWADKSGNGRSPANTADAEQPALIEAEQNGLDVLRFDGSNDYLLFPSSTATDYALKFGTDSFAVFAVLKPSSLISGGNYFFGARGYDEGWLAGFSLDDPVLRMYMLGEQWVPMPMSAVTATTSWQLFVATAPRGATGRYYRNGALAQSTIANVGTASMANSRQVRIGSYTDNSNNTTGAFAGDLAEVILIAGIVADETRQTIEGYFAHKWGLAGALPADHPYKEYAPGDSPVVILHASLEQPYGDVPALYASLVQPWSILLETWLAQPYGDVPVLEVSLDQRWNLRAATELAVSLVQRWNNTAAELDVCLEQPYSLPGLLEVSCEQRYGIVAEVLHVSLAQLYQINERTTLFAHLIQPYAMASEAARLYYFSIELYLDDVRFPFNSLEWQASDGAYCWECDFSTNDYELAQRCVEGVVVKIVTPWDTWILKCYDGWVEDRRHGQRLYRMTAESRTRDLDRAMPLTEDLPDGMASQLVAALAAPFGIAVNWQMADGWLVGTELDVVGKTPLTVIKDIVHDARGIVQSTYAGDLLIVAAQEVAIPEYPTVTPAETIVTRLERISTSESIDDQRGYNLVIVSDQTSSESNYTWDEIEIDARTKEYRLYVTPLIAERNYTLTHSAGAGITIEPFGVRSLAITDDLVQIVAGSGQATKPIYSLTAVKWQKTNLGEVYPTETGLVTTEIAGYSLVKLSYLTKFWRWVVRDQNIEPVQLIFREV